MTTQTPLQILCEWAWSKVNLEQLQKQGDPDLVYAAIIAFRHALRNKKKLDLEYSDHHQALAELEQNKPIQGELCFA